MDRIALVAKLDRLAALRGDPVLGLPPSEWAESLAGVDRDLVMRAAIAAVRELVVPEWADRRKDDERPELALRAAEAWLAQPGPEAVTQAKVTAKACTAARSETFGYDHRVAEAARSVAWAVGAADASTLFDAFASVEAELLARIALTAEYHRAPEQRRALIGVLRRVLVPPEPPAAAPPPPEPRGELPPVPYSVDQHFELGQRIVHKKFGDVIVTALGESTIEVELADGGKKRLTHRP